MRTARIVLIAAACVGTLTIGGAPRLHSASAGTLPAPQITDPVLATLASRELTINGVDLGLPTSLRELRFTSPDSTVVVSADSPLITAWTPASIALQVPPAAQTGVVRVVVDGQQSLPVDIMIFEYSSTRYPGSLGHPLALAVATDNRVWITEEFQSSLRVLTPGEAPTTAEIAIPQSQPGIFASDHDSDRRTEINMLGEDIDADGDGSLWFTQGGKYIYEGIHPNTSRVVQYRPATSEFRCYIVPNDNAQVTSVVIDHDRQYVWYVLGALDGTGNAIGGFDYAAATSNCLFDPLLSPRPPLCSQLPAAGCHRRFPLPQLRSGPMHVALSPTGDLWFSEYWANRIGVLDPDTGILKELPLPPSRIRQGQGVFVGSAPARMVFDDNGDLWLAEEFDATIDRVRPSLMSTSNCFQLDATNNNPCIEEIFVGSNGVDGVTVHTVFPGNGGLVWFTLNGQSHTLLAEDAIDPSSPRPQIGFVDTNRGDAVVLLPTLDDVAFNAGIIQDPATGEIWFAEYLERGIGRLRTAAGDGDGIPSVVDNCPEIYNPNQGNVDANFIDHPLPITQDDKTVARSDAPGDACDADDDNDGITDNDEASGAPCAGKITNPHMADTDADRILDGAECMLGTNPTSSASKPMAAQCATYLGVVVGTDTDGDKLRDYIEFCNYNTDRTLIDTDGDRTLDGAADGCEATSFNGDRIVNVADRGMLTQAIADPARRHVNLDVNKDGVWNVGDVGLVTMFFSKCPG